MATTNQYQSGLVRQNFATLGQQMIQNPTGSYQPSNLNQRYYQPQEYYSQKPTKSHSVNQDNEDVIQQLALLDKLSAPLLRNHGQPNYKDPQEKSRANSARIFPIESNNVQDYQPYVPMPNSYNNNNSAEKEIFQKQIDKQNELIQKLMLQLNEGSKSGNNPKFDQSLLQLQDSHLKQEINSLKQELQNLNQQNNSSQQQFQNALQKSQEMYKSQLQQQLQQLQQSHQQALQQQQQQIQQLQQTPQQQPQQQPQMPQMMQYPGTGSQMMYPPPMMPLLNPYMMNQGMMLGMGGLPFSGGSSMQSEFQIKRMINDTVKNKQLEDKVKNLEMQLQDQFLKSQLLQLNQNQMQQSQLLQNQLQLQQQKQFGQQQPVQQQPIVIQGPTNGNTDLNQIAQKPLDQNKTQQPVKPQKKKRNIKLMRRFWMAIFAMYIYVGVQKNYKSLRFQFFNSFKKLFEDHLMKLTSWLKQIIKEPLQNLVSNPQLDLDIVAKSTNVVDPKIVQQRCMQIIGICEQILVQFRNQMSTFPEFSQWFYQNCYYEKGWIPPYFIFQFELDRLQLHPRLGYLVDVNIYQRYMLYSFDCLLKLLISNILTRPWQFTTGSQQIKDTPQNRQTLKQIGSILYILIMDYFRQKCPKINCSQDQIPENYKIFPITKTLPIIYDTSNMQVEDDTSIECVTGLFKKSDLGNIFENNINSINSIVTKLEDALFDLDQKIMQQHEQYYQGIKQEQVKENKQFLLQLPPYLRK